MIKVLWIEDGAFDELNLMSGPVIVDSRYDLTVALDATAGLDCLADENNQFDVIVVDVRLPPGDDRRFVERYDQNGESRIAARLGLMLLERVFSTDNEDDLPSHHQERRKFAVFTAESRLQVEKDLIALGLEPDGYHFQKTVHNDMDKLRQIIDTVWRR